MKVNLFHSGTGNMSSPFWRKNKTKQNVAQTKNFCVTEDHRRLLFNKVEYFKLVFLQLN